MFGVRKGILDLNLITGIMENHIHNPNMFGRSLAIGHKLGHKRKLLPLFVAITLFSITISSAHANVYSFSSNCSNNLAGDVLIGQNQLNVDVTNPGANQVLFTFTNTGPSASSITDIYFDDGSLLGIASIVESPPSVDFGIGASPPNLPDANNCPGPDFATTAGFSADSESPTQPSGVNPGESVGILFNLQAGKTFADVINDLNSGALRIGIHVQGFASGGSESFINSSVIDPDPCDGIDNNNNGIIDEGVVGTNDDGDGTIDEADEACVPTAETAEISGMKFEDLDGDGVKDGGELGLEGWEITIDCDNGFSASTTTDATGFYSFIINDPPDDLPTTCSVEETEQAGWIVTTTNPITGIAISDGDAVPNQDFGNFKLGEIHGLKFDDTNGDGVRDEGELGLAGWDITITGFDTITDEAVDETVTTMVDDPGTLDVNEAGMYWITGLTQGDYTVCEEPTAEQAAAWIQTAPGVSTTFEECYDITINSGTVATGKDFGNFKLGEIHGLKFYDITGDGTKQNEEPTIPNWQIRITGLDEITGDAVDETVTTMANGMYWLTGLTKGTYTATEILVSGWTNTTPLSITPIDILSGTVSENNDFGNQCRVSTGGMSKGFWTNKNGENTLKDSGTLAPELALLVSRNLRNADGSNFDPISYNNSPSSTALKPWLTDAYATNMAYMLSAQYAAAELNVEAGKVSSSAVIYAPELLPYLSTVGPSLSAIGTITIGDLLTATNAELGLHGQTLADSPYRAYQEALKNVNEKIDTNASIVLCPLP
jgi:hypothetical protein